MSATTNELLLHSERERERERDTDRQTEIERQTDRQRQTDWGGGGGDRERESQIKMHNFMDAETIYIVNLTLYNITMKMYLRRRSSCTGVYSYTG